MSLAVALIFLVLAAQFNSFRDPLVILGGSVPLAAFGSAVFMFLKFPAQNVPFFTDGWTTTFNIYSQVGLVTLVGLIAKNGILIVEFANKLQLAGKPKLEAVHDAALTRLRPILMTTVATVAGHFPLTLVTGAGAAARNSIGLVLVGGLSIGTFFTLFVMPAIYMLIAKDHSRDRAREAAIRAPEALSPRRTHEHPILVSASLLMAWASALGSPTQAPAELPSPLDLKGPSAMPSTTTSRSCRRARRSAPGGVIIQVRSQQIPNLSAQGQYERNAAAISQVYPPSSSLWPSS